jgi:transposase-like protein
MDAPATLQEAIIYFSDEERCREFMVAYRWPDGVVTCPTCGRDDVRWLAVQKRWECRARHPRKQFSIKVGTIFEDSPISLLKWLPALWMLANDKNGISSYELARAIGVTQKTAWFMLSRIRLAMHDEEPGILSGDVEVDETYIGGKARNMHQDRRKKLQTSKYGRITPRSGKVIVQGLIERKGRVRMAVVKGSRQELQGNVRAAVAPGTNLYSDAAPAYSPLADDYVHEVVDHAAEEYVRGKVYTNTIENFWALLKRTLGGTYISTEPFHLFRYLDEQAFRFNERELTDRGRFLKVVTSTQGKRLTYKKLTGRSDSDSLRGAGNALA